jgi:predicted AlkP superfamily pyrophosphatase or phosphodiesterase
MTVLARCAFLFALLVLGGCAGTSPRRTAAPGAHALILVSIDGFRADYFERDVTPALAALAKDGVRAQALKPAFPTLTFPNHYTLVTGLYPDHLGIVNNRMIDPVTGAQFVYKDDRTIADPAWWGGEPLWVGVEKQGRHAATMFWPGSDVAIDGVRPSHWQHFDGSLSPDRRVDRLLGWTDLPGAERPAFYTLYLEQVDHAGHEFGPDSPEVDAALREVDAALAHLVAGLRQRGLFETTNIVIVSDHGMTPTSRDRKIYLDDIVTLTDIDVITLGILAGLQPKATGSSEAERALLAPPAHMQCWRKSEIPPRLHYGTNPRIPALLCLADDGWLITTRASDAARKHFSLGEHGYDNEDPNMRALFVAHGPAFRRGVVVPEFDSVDVYALLALVLGIRAAPNDGDLSQVVSVLDSAAR